MIIALVGRPFSWKSKIAEELLSYFDGRYELLRPYTTDPTKSPERYQFVQEEDIGRNLFHGVVTYQESSEGYKYFTLKQQYWGRNDVICLLDDTKMLKAIRLLEIPYAVVYVDCAYGKILSRARYAEADINPLVVKLDKMRPAMRWLQLSFDYSFYVDTTLLPHKRLVTAVREFADRVELWSEVRETGGIQMPTISGVASTGWLRKAREVGWFMVEITGAEEV